MNGMASSGIASNEITSKMNGMASSGIASNGITAFHCFLILKDLKNHALQRRGICLVVHKDIGFLALFD